MCLLPGCEKDECVSDDKNIFREDFPTTGDHQDSEWKKRPGIVVPDNTFKDESEYPVTKKEIEEKEGTFTLCRRFILNGFIQKKGNARQNKDCQNGDYRPLNLNSYPFFANAIRIGKSNNKMIFLLKK